MKIAIASSHEMKCDPLGQNQLIPDQPWHWVEFSDLYPAQIRAWVAEWLLKEEMIREVAGEFCIITLNRTVLDMVGRGMGIDYEDVFMFKDGKLVPLLELRDGDSLLQRRLGDLLEGGELT